MQGGDVNDNPFDFDLWTDGTMEVNMQDVKLKPCPFCGGEAELVCTTDNHHSPYVRCKYGVYLKPKCTANMYPWRYKTAEEAVEAWNRRAEKVAVRYRADKENGKYVCSECGHNVIWNPDHEDKLMMWHPYCNTCGAKILRIEDYGDPKQEV
jgi:transcription elongation factor Elf1